MLRAILIPTILAALLLTGCRNIERSSLDAGTPSGFLAMFWATMPWIVVAPLEVNVTEGGPPAAYTVSLSREPMAEVTVTATPDAQLLLDGGSEPVSHAFNGANWSIPWSVSVSGRADALYEGKHTGVLTHTVTTADFGYNRTSIPALNAIINDGWVHQAYLKAPNGDVDDEFGQSLAVSGDTMVVGARFEGSNQTTITNGTAASPDNSALAAGAAYVFVRTGSTWTQQAYLKAPNAGANDLFGEFVAVSGDTIVVGALFEDSNQTTITNGTAASADNSTSNSGAAYVFVRTGTTWTQQAYLKAPNADAEDNFGFTGAVSGDTVVVGARYEDSNQTTITNGTAASPDNSAPTAGAAYVFVRSGTTWSQQAYLKAHNSDADDIFSQSLAISGDTIVVGAIYEDSDHTTITNGTTISGDNANNAQSGAAYVFVRSGTTWSQQAYLKAPNNTADDEFGFSVALSGDTIVVGVYREDSNQTTVTNGTVASADNSATNSGAAYVFTRTGTAWSQQAFLKAPNNDAGDRFGLSVAVSGDTIVVVAPGEDSNTTAVINGQDLSATNNSGNNHGAAYVFVRSGTTWSHQAYLKAPNSDFNDNFGGSDGYLGAVAISGDTIVVGSPYEDSNQTTITNGTVASPDNSATKSGAAYVFKLWQ